MNPKVLGVQQLNESADSNIACLQAVREFAWLGVSGVVSMTEWWYWEAAAFVAGRLGPVALAAHSVRGNTNRHCGCSDSQMAS